MPDGNSVSPDVIPRKHRVLCFNTSARNKLNLIMIKHQTSENEERKHN